MRQERTLLRQTGFSVVELVVVVAIVLIVLGISLPGLVTTIEDNKLRAAAQELAGIYQEGRIRSARVNNYYEVLVTPAGVTPAIAWIDMDGNGQLDAGEPQVQLPRGMFLSNNGVPGGLDDVKLGFTPFRVETSTMYSQQDINVPGLAWNARGLPCQRTSPTSICSNSTATGPAGWVQYIQMQRSGGQASYAAVSISPAGRVKVWTYVPAAGGGNWD
jgi:Tfp pilus assembly protein FimT